MLFIVGRVRATRKTYNVVDGDTFAISEITEVIL